MGVLNGRSSFWNRKNAREKCCQCLKLNFNPQKKPQMSKLVLLLLDYTVKPRYPKQS
jgi:hypothetical protein